MWDQFPAKCCIRAALWINAKSKPLKCGSREYDTCEWRRMQTPLDVCVEMTHRHSEGWNLSAGRTRSGGAQQIHSSHEPVHHSAVMLICAFLNAFFFMRIGYNMWEAILQFLKKTKRRRKKSLIKKKNLKYFQLFFLMRKISATWRSSKIPPLLKIAQ